MSAGPALRSGKGGGAKRPRARASLLAVLCPFLAGASGPEANLAPNPGFEVSTDTGGAAGWRVVQPAFRVARDQARSGGQSLRMENADTKNYVLCSSPVSLTPGRRYEVEAWVRTTDVRGGHSGGATLCVEWSDASGRFIGGEYPPGLTGTHTNWTRVHALTGRVPTNAARFSLSCYLRRGATGTAWWDDVAVREYRPPVIDAMTTGCYRDASDGGVVTVHAGLALEENRLDAASARVALAVRDSAGRCVATGTVVSAEAGEAAIAFDATPLAPGAFSLECMVRDGAGVEVGRQSLRFTRLASLPQRKAYVDGHRRLVLDGRPFFPLGTYWGGVTAKEVALYAKSPFNCIMPYADIGRAGVDLAWSNGLRVIYSVKDLYPGHRHIASSEEARNAIAGKVTSLRDHPGILAWYINDELPVTMRDELSAHRRWLEELDPGRPTWAVLYQVDQLRDYLPTFDIVGTDPYPIGRGQVAQARDWARKTRRATFGSRAVWMVPQIFDWAVYRGAGGDDRKACPPTLAEMRCMAWSCIAEGANGLIFYSWFDLWRMDKTVAEGGRATVREPFEERWRDVTTMAAEIRDFIPVLLSVEPAPVPRIEAPDSFAWRVLAKEGATWLVAVNHDASNSVTAAVRFPASFSKATGRLAGAQPEGGGTDWRLTLPPLAVQCVRLEK